MHASRSILQRFGLNGGSSALSRSTRLAARHVQRPSIWLREPPRTAITAIAARLQHQVPARPFSTSAAVTQDPTTCTASSQAQPTRQDVPSYEMRFTCKKCMMPQTHRMSKQAYHNGTVLVTCPGCKNRHLIADHLKIFSDDRITLEDILKQNGELLKRGTLNADGKIEFWEDGTTQAESPPLRNTEPLRIEAEPPRKQ